MTNIALSRDHASANLRALSPEGWEIWVTDRTLLAGLVHDARQLGVTTFALWRLGLQPNNAAFVGHATDELLGAAAIGLTTIAFRPDDPNVDADAHIEDLRELDDLLP